MFNTKLEGYAKTINLIEGRINQMSTYLPTREKIAKNDKELIEFLEISGFRYETLKDTLDYIKHLWSMTKNYIVSAQKLFNGLNILVSIPNGIKTIFSSAIPYLISLSFVI